MFSKNFDIQFSAVDVLLNLFRSFFLRNFSVLMHRDHVYHYVDDVTDIIDSGRVTIFRRKIF